MDKNVFLLQYQIIGEEIVKIFNAVLISECCITMGKE